MPGVPGPHHMSRHGCVSAVANEIWTMPNWRAEKVQSHATFSSLYDPIVINRSEVFQWYVHKRCVSMSRCEHLWL